MIIETDVQSRYKIGPEQIQRALTPRSCAFVFNSPSSPSGAAYEADEVVVLDRVLETRNDITVISDEIYDQFLYEGREHFSFAAASPHANPRPVMTRSLEKSTLVESAHGAYA